MGTLAIPQHFPKVALNDFVAIFNYVHRILLLDTNSKSLSLNRNVAIKFLSSQIADESHR